MLEYFYFIQSIISESLKTFIESNPSSRKVWKLLFWQIHCLGKCENFYFRQKAKGECAKYYTLMENRIRISQKNLCKTKPLRNESKRRWFWLFAYICKRENFGRLNPMWTNDLKHLIFLGMPINKLLFRIYFLCIVLIRLIVKVFTLFPDRF